jgi:hypothetical protein
MGRVIGPEGDPTVASVSWVKKKYNTEDLRRCLTICIN